MLLVAVPERMMSDGRAISLSLDLFCCCSIYGIRECVLFSSRHGGGRALSLLNHLSFHGVRVCVRSPMREKKAGQSISVPYIEQHDVYLAYLRASLDLHPVLIFP